MEHKPSSLGAISGTNKQRTDEFSLVYYYLLAGITLLVAVFLLLPRVSAG